MPNTLICLLVAASIPCAVAQAAPDAECLSALFRSIHEQREQLTRQAGMVHDLQTADALAETIEQQKAAAREKQLDQWQKDHPQTFAAVSPAWQKPMEQVSDDMCIAFFRISWKNWYGSKTLKNNASFLADEKTQLDPEQVAHFMSTYHLNPRPKKITWFLSLLPNMLNGSGVPEAGKNPFTFFLAAVFKNDPSHLQEWMTIIKEMPSVASRSVALGAMSHCAVTMPEAKKLVEAYLTSNPGERPLVEKPPVIDPAAMKNIQDYLQLFSCTAYYAGSGDLAALKPVFACSVLPSDPQDRNTLAAMANSPLAFLIAEDPAARKALKDYLTTCTKEQRLAFSRFHTKQVQIDLLGEVLTTDPIDLSKPYTEEEDAPLH